MLAVAVIAGVLGLGPPAIAETIPGPVEARVIRVLDGDTLIVEVRLWFGQTIVEHVRITGIDAPEMKGRCPTEIAAARDARRYLAGLAGLGLIELRDVRREKYGRALARVTASGLDIASRMIEAGVARPYSGGRRQGWCG